MYVVVCHPFECGCREFLCMSFVIPSSIPVAPLSPSQVLLQDPHPMLYHGEVVLRDGAVVGDIRTGTYVAAFRQNDM